MPVKTPERPPTKPAAGARKGVGQLSTFVSAFRNAPTGDSDGDVADPTPRQRTLQAAKATGKDAAKTAAKTATKKAVVHVATKNPYVTVVIVVVVFMLAIVLGPIIWLGTGNANPNPLALQLAHAQTGTTTADIPPVVYAAYVQAAAQASTFHPDCALRPAILAGIGWRESGHGTFGGAVADANGDIAPPIIGIPLDGTNGTAVIVDTDDGFWDTDTVWDRAVGPMQFIPSSWVLFGQDGNGDGIENPHNIFDASLAAVAHLCAASPVDMNASEEALRAAIYAYNHSTEYVDAVMARIAYYDIALAGNGFSGDATALLANPNFDGCAAAINDLETGQIDVRAISVMSAIVQTHSIYVCPLKSGHYQCVGGGSLTSNPYCTESHHWYGRGVDIGSVDGIGVSSSNVGAYAIVQWLTTFPAGDPIRPNVGSPWPEFDALAGFFHDSDHTGHIHLGFCGPRWANGVWGDSCA